MLEKINLLPNKFRVLHIECVLFKELDRKN